LIPSITVLVIHNSVHTKSGNSMSKKRKGEVRPPDYRSKPTAVSFTVYDMQGDPISPNVEALILPFIEAFVKDYGANSLAISVDRG